MNLEKALSILGLQRNFTEEELKKAYRHLITIYHPDKWEDKTENERKIATEKTKEINAAKDFLERNYKNQPYINKNHNNNYYHDSNYKNDVLLQAKVNFLRELRKYNEELLGLAQEKEIILLEKIATINILHFEYRHKIININNINDLNRIIISYKADIWKQLEIFTIEYCKKYNIKTDISRLEKYSLKTLYEELENLRKIQNPIITKLNQKQEEYIYYTGYDKIKENIQKIKKDIILAYLNNFYKSEAEAINYFHKKVLEEFKEYYISSEHRSKGKTYVKKHPTKKPKYKIKKNI